MLFQYNITLYFPATENIVITLFEKCIIQVKTVFVSPFFKVFQPYTVLFCSTHCKELDEMERKVTLFLHLKGYSPALFLPSGFSILNPQMPLLLVLPPIYSFQ